MFVIPPRFSANRAAVPDSVALPKDPGTRGWRIVGPAACDTFMHAPGCAIRGEAARARASFRAPGGAKAPA